MLTEQFIKKLKQTTSSTHFRKRMEEFVYFMEQSIGGERFIDVLQKIAFSYPLYTTTQGSDRVYNASDVQALALDFYQDFDSSLGIRAEAILSNNNPQIHAELSDSYTSHGYVNHCDNNDYITLRCELDNSISSSIILVHELSHALSNNLTILAKLSKKLINSKDESVSRTIKNHIRNLSCLKPIRRDAVGEIESHIFELLYCDYLLQKGLVSEDYVHSFHNLNQVSMYNNILTLVEDYTCIKSITYPINKMNLETNLAKSNISLGHLTDFYNRFMDIGFMFRHQLRYVVAEIIATDWFDKYSLSSPRTQSNMRTRLKKYLDSCYNQDVESACKLLLKKNLSTSVQDFIKIKNRSIITKDDYEEQKLL